MWILFYNCVSHRGDDLCTHQRDDLRGVQHTAEINCTPRKQNRILYLSMVALLGVNASIMKEKIWSIICWFITTNFLSQLCAAHHGDHFVIEYLGRNQNRIQKYFSLFSRGPNGVESWIKWRSKISWHTPFNAKYSMMSKLLFDSEGRTFSV